MTYERKTEKGSSLFEHPLNELLNTENPLLVLAEKIDWKFIEKNLSPLYSKRGRPAHPIRLMAGLLMLKSLRNLSDEVLVDEHTTVQEKNITFPTDAKLHKKIIERCNKIAKKEGVKLRDT